MRKGFIEETARGKTLYEDMEETARGRVLNYWDIHETARGMILNEGRHGRNRKR